MKKSINFYFDFISPYAWLAWPRLKIISERYHVQLNAVPTLFAGLLKANGQLGPAEIPNKRIWLIKDVSRRATRMGMKLLSPPTHPFKPLLPLRTAVAARVFGNHSFQDQVVSGLLNACWSQGKDISDELVVRQVLSELSIPPTFDFVTQVNSDFVKDALKANTEEAVRAGVFGVPSTIVDGELYWGSEDETLNQIEDAIISLSLPSPPPNQTSHKYDHEVLQRWKNTLPSAERKR